MPCLPAKDGQCMLCKTVLIWPWCLRLFVLVSLSSPWCAIPITKQQLHRSLHADGTLSGMDARALRLLQQVLDLSGPEAPGPAPPIPAKRIVAHSCVEAALPAAHRAAICHNEVVQQCCDHGMLETGVSTDGATWLWLTPAGEEACIERFGRL